MGLVHHPNVVSDGLVGCWDAANRKSYPGTGDDWGDLVNSATAEGQNFDQTPEHVNDWAGAFLLDGTDEYFTIPDADLEVVGAFTFSVWLRFTTATTDGTGGYVVFAIRGGSGWSAEFALSILNNISGWVAHSVRIGCKSSSSFMARWDSGIYSPYSNYNVWRNYCAVYNGDGPDDPDNFTFYFDGVDQGTRDNQYRWGINANSTKWSKDDSSAGYLGGYLGAIHLHDRALTAAEILQNYEAMKPRFEPKITKSGLVGNWDAGDPESYVGGLTCKDTANGTEATLENNGTNFNFHAANGGYWEFDGTDDYIQCSTNSVLQPQSFSLEAWVYDNQSESHRPIASWNTTAETPSVWTRYTGSRTAPLSYMSGTQWRYFLATAVNVTGWHHVVFTYTYDDITTAALYVDGYTQSVLFDPYNVAKDSTDTFRIGRANTRYYDGKIGLVRMYDSSLSAAEIMDNFQKTRGRFGV